MIGPIKKAAQINDIAQPTVIASVSLEISSSPTPKVAINEGRNTVNTEFIPMLAKRAMQAPMTAFFALDLLCINIHSFLKFVHKSLPYGNSTTYKSI